MIIDAASNLLMVGATLVTYGRPVAARVHYIRRYRPKN